MSVNRLRLLPEDIFAAEHLSHDLAGKSVRGGATTMGAQGVMFLLGMARTIVLARLLTPQDFGLIGMVTVVIGFATMFKDAGLSMATVQKNHITHEQISTLFWINVLISVTLGLGIIAGAPLVAMFYHRPELTAVTAALALSFIIQGLTIQHGALLRRHMRFVPLALEQIFAAVMGMTVAIILALLGWRYWALVGSAIASAITMLLLTLLFCPWLPGRMKKDTGIVDMLKFGVHLTGFSFINYFSRNADNLLIGKFIGADGLGLYAKAYRLFMMPIKQIRSPINRVAMPVLSSLQNQPERYVKYYQRLIDILATLSVPLTLYCALEAEFLIRLLLGEQWLGAVPVFRILAIGGLISPVAGTRGLVLISCGYSKRYFYWGLAHAIITVTSFIAGLPFGITGVATAYTIAIFAILIPSLYYCFHKTPVKVSLFLKTLAVPLLAGMAGAAGVLLVKYAVRDESVVIHLLYAGIFAVIYGGLSWSRKSIRETLYLWL